jgi:hypothetical protein
LSLSWWRQGRESVLKVTFSHLDSKITSFRKMYLSYF